MFKGLRVCRNTMIMMRPMLVTMIVLVAAAAAVVVVLGGSWDLVSKVISRL